MKIVTRRTGSKTRRQRLAEMAVGASGVASRPQRLTDSTDSVKFAAVSGQDKRTISAWLEGRIDDVAFSRSQAFERLLDFYSEDMPYGTAKARDGDPLEWVRDKLIADKFDYVEESFMRSHRVTIPQKKWLHEQLIREDIGKIINLNPEQGKPDKPTITGATHEWVKAFKRWYDEGAEGQWPSYDAVTFVRSQMTKADFMQVVKAIGERFPIQPADTDQEGDTVTFKFTQPRLSISVALQDGQIRAMCQAHRDINSGLGEGRRYSLAKYIVSGKL